MKDEDYWTQVVTHLLMKAYGKSTVIWIHIITGAVLAKYIFLDGHKYECFHSSCPWTFFVKIGTVNATDVLDTFLENT